MDLFLFIDIETFDHMNILENQLFLNLETSVSLCFKNSGDFWYCIKVFATISLNVYMMSLKDKSFFDIVLVINPLCLVIRIRKHHS